MRQVFLSAAKDSYCRGVGGWQIEYVVCEFSSTETGREELETGQVFG